MKITIDKNTIESYLSRGIRELFVGFIQSGCHGTKVSVSEEFDRAGLESYPQENGLVLYVQREDAHKLDGARLTRVGDKWILSSDKIASRCGCGSSFSFEKKAIDPEKLKKIAKLFWKTTG